MIQRIQSVYLFLAALFSGLLVFFVNIINTSAGNYGITEYPIFMSMFLASAALSTYAIFSFKKRRLQVVLGRINIILNFFLLGVLVYETFAGFFGVDAKLDIGAFIPLSVVVLVTLANRAIMKDETMVRAADRLR